MKATGFEVRNGVIRHAHGELRATTVGQERGELHVELMRAGEESSRNAAEPKAAARALAVFEQDPSLLLETIPSRYPLVRTEKEVYINADTVWKNISTWYGSWAGRFHAQSSVPVVKFALKCGIHPDDRSVWGGFSLLDDDDFQSRAENVELALRYGASPDPDDQAPGNSYLMRCLTEIQALVKRGGSEQRDAEKLRDVLVRANLLLNAGPTRLDFDPFELSQRNGGSAAKGLRTPIGMLADLAGAHHYAKEGLDKEVFALMGKLHRAGANLDCPNGVLGLPPVMQCIYAMNIEGACELIRLGCRTDVEAIPRPGRTGQLKSLMDEAAERGGENFRTRLVAACMERDMAAAAKLAPVSESKPIAPRRRTREV